MGMDYYNDSLITCWMGTQYCNECQPSELVGLRNVVHVLILSYLVYGNGVL